MTLSVEEQRAAELAVSRYGADPTRVDGLVTAARTARARGDVLHLLDLFERERLLSVAELHDLRFGLEKTHIDPVGPDGNGKKHDAHAEPGDDAALKDLRALGDYRILRRPARAAWAVFLAFHEKDQQQVALKVLSSQLAKNQVTLDRFYREIKSGALLNHANIVRNYAAGQDRATGLHYLVLEFVDGASGQELLERHGKLTIGDATHIVLDVAKALEHAHSRSVVHRDIKPGNILVMRSGLAKLADLGLAKRTDETSHLTHTRQGFGTPYYMPYEQAMNARKADARADIYALGATLYHFITGEVPFPGANSLEIIDKKGLGEFLPASTHNPNVPIELDRILARMLAREPQDRYQTMSEVIVDLERANLAAPVPSFVDQADVNKDPLMRERLAAAPQATVLDVRQAAGAQPQFWYVLYKDSRGFRGKAKMTAALVKRRLESGKLTPKAKAAKSPKGPYAPLYAIAEFDTFAPPAVLRPSRKGQPAAPRPPTYGTRTPRDEVHHRRWWLLSFALIVIVLSMVAYTVFAWPE